MKTVRLQNSAVVEIIPEYALPVEKWYGAEFAKQCVEAPNEVEQGWIYNTEAKIFSEPSSEPEPVPTPRIDPPTTADMAEMLIDLETRTSLLEMGVKK